MSIYGCCVYSSHVRHNEYVFRSKVSWSPELVKILTFVCSSHWCPKDTTVFLLSCCHHRSSYCHY